MSAQITIKQGWLRTLGLSAVLVAGFVLVGCGGKDPAPTDARNQEIATTAPETRTEPRPDVPMTKAEPVKGKLDPCALLTKADAEAVIGEPAKEAERPPTPTNYLGIQHCFYGAASDRSFASAQILVIQAETIEERARKNGVTVRRIFEETKALTEGQVQPVAGVGDDAYFSGRKLEVLKGNTYLSISMMPKRLADPMTPATEAAMKDAARNALRRLSN